MTDNLSNDKPASLSVLAAQIVIRDALATSRFSTPHVIRAAEAHVERANDPRAPFESSQFYELRHPNAERFTVTIEVTTSGWDNLFKCSRIDERGDRITTVKPEVKVNWGCHGAVPFLCAEVYAELLKGAADVAFQISDALQPGISYVSATAEELLNAAAREAKRELERLLINAWAGDADLRLALYDTRRGATKHAATPELIRSKLADGEGVSVTYDLTIPGKKIKRYKLMCDVRNTYVTRIA